MIRALWLVMSYVDNSIYVHILVDLNGIDSTRHLRDLAVAAKLKHLIEMHINILYCIPSCLQGRIDKRYIL